MELDVIYRGDCLEVMKQFPDKSIDVLLADPPYNAKNIGPEQKVYSLGVMQLPAKDYARFCKSWFREANRVCKRLVFTPGIANVCNYPQPSWIACWHKPAAVSFNRFGGFNAWEPIMLYGKIPKGNRLPQDYLLCNTLNFSKGPEKDHPCPKPLKLIARLVEIFSLPGDIILDPFMGSGTTCVAAAELERHYIGIELNPDYIKLAEKRLEAIQQRLIL